MHGMRNIPVVGSGLRWVTAQYRDGSVVTIPMGTARGLKWKRYHAYVNGFWIGNFEIWIQRTITDLLCTGQTFYDIGANAGFFSLVARAKIGPEGRCISVDPDPWNCRTIRQQAELNGFSNCSVFEAAVSDHSGTGQLALSAPGDSEAKLDTSGGGGTDQLAVQLITLDELCRQYHAPNVIKIDIEGAEVAALRGAQKLLWETRPTWIIEVHGVHLALQLRQIFDQAFYDVAEFDSNPGSHDWENPRHFVARPQRL